MADTENNALTALIEAGADAQSNMYDVELEFADWNATVRADGFEIPTIEAPTYSNKYHGVSYDRVKTEQNFERKFSMTFRMDAKYGLYQSFTSLLAWHVDPNTGGVANANIDKVGTVTVRTINSAIVAAGTSEGSEYSASGVDTVTSSSSQGIKDGSGVLTWKFKGCFVTKVGMPSYKTDGADNITFAVDFHFGQVEYPGFQVNS